MRLFSAALFIGWSLAVGQAHGTSGPPIRVAKPDGESGPIFGCFGTSVALSHNVAFAGDPCDGGKGAVYRLRRHGAGWIVDARIEAPATTQINGGFGASLAINGNVLGIGAPQGDGGRVYFVDDILTETLNISGVSAPSTTSGYAGFGTSITAYPTSLSGTQFLAGATQGACPSGIDGGFVVAVPEGMPTFMCAPGQSEWAGFGGALKSQGNFVLVSAPNVAPPAGSTGAGYLYDLGIPGFYAPSLKSVFVPTDPDGNRRFGQSLDMNASTIVFGAPTNDEETPGNAWVYEGAITNWSLVAILSEPSSQPSAEFGASLVLGADKLWVGSPSSSNGGTIYEYARSSDGWHAVDHFEAEPRDRSGRLGASLTADRSTWIAGAPWANAVDTQHWTGAVYISTDDYVFEGGFDR